MRSDTVSRTGMVKNTTVAVAAGAGAAAAGAHPGETYASGHRPSPGDEPEAADATNIEENKQRVFFPFSFFYVNFFSSTSICLQ
jgi:hypothetical protein